MPAYTVTQLESLLGEYVEPGKNFTMKLAQVLPRLYAMGLWRDITYETSLDGSLGYVTLPADTDSVLASTVNNYPRPVRSLWHDVRIVGRQAVLSSYFGIVDDGYYPVILSMKDVQAVDAEADVTGPTSLTAYAVGTDTAINTDDFQGAVVITYQTTTSAGSSVQEATADSDLAFALSGGALSITSIVYDNVNTPFDLKDPNFLTKIIATVPQGSGVCRFRRFRVCSPNDDTTVHLLVKRECPVTLFEDTIVHLGNINAIKHGLLAVIAEDNSDTDKSRFHWGECFKLLDEELVSILGAAKPTLTVDLSGGGSAWPIHNLM